MTLNHQACKVRTVFNVSPIPPLDGSNRPKPKSTGLGQWGRITLHCNTACVVNRYVGVSWGHTGCFQSALLPSRSVTPIERKKAS